MMVIVLRDAMTDRSTAYDIEILMQIQAKLHQIRIFLTTSWAIPPWATKLSWARQDVNGSNSDSPKTNRCSSTLKAAFLENDGRRLDQVARNGCCVFAFLGVRFPFIAYMVPIRDEMLHIRVGSTVSSIPGNWERVGIHIDLG